jgi:hypothetical protein
MLSEIHPKLPMRNQTITHDFYVKQLGFQLCGSYPGYLMVQKDQIQIHFFEFAELDPLLNDGQVYIRTDDIEALYDHLRKAGVAIHPNGHLAVKPWGQKEFSVLDPDHNLLTFGQPI